MALHIEQNYVHQHHVALHWVPGAMLQFEGTALSLLILLDMSLERHNDISIDMVLVWTADAEIHLRLQELFALMVCVFIEVDGFSPFRIHIFKVKQTWWNSCWFVVMSLTHYISLSMSNEMIMGCIVQTYHHHTPQTLIPHHQLVMRTIGQHDASLAGMLITWIVLFNMYLLWLALFLVLLGQFDPSVKRNFFNFGFDKNSFGVLFLPSNEAFLQEG